MLLCQVELASLVLFKLVILLKIFGTNCDALNSNTKQPVATLKIFNNEGHEISSSDLVEIYAAPNASVEKITGKLIYAKTYDQALLDKILNKSDTYYKRCACIATNASASASQGEFIVLIDRADQCSLDDNVQCAVDMKSSALLLNGLNNAADSSSVRLKGYPIEVILMQNSLGQKLVKFLNSNLSSNLTASIDATNTQPRGQSIVQLDAISSSSTGLPLATTTSFMLSTTPSITSQYRSLTTASILAIVFGILLIVFVLIGLFTLFVYMQKVRLREDREKIQDLIEKLTKRAISSMENKILKKEDELIQQNEVCVICLENFKPKDSVRILPCLHIFHKEEIDKWIYKNHSCPVCKIDILKAAIDSSSDHWRNRLMVRLGLAKSPYELHEAVQAFYNYRRHHSIDIESGRDRRYSAFNQNTVTTMASTSEEQRSRVFSEFVSLHQKRFSIDALNSALENDNWRQDGRKRIRRLNFFGETLEDFDYGDEDDAVFSVQQTMTSTDTAGIPQALNEERHHDHLSRKNEANAQVVQQSSAQGHDEPKTPINATAARIEADGAQSLIRMNSSVEIEPQALNQQEIILCSPTSLPSSGNTDNQFKSISLEEEIIPK